ncbi:MAG: hypothetical protein U5K37_00440 [Natrialbaceae archaeon]|nr:hypothetical protein [Natrialbaceae archaeon]
MKHSLNPFLVAQELNVDPVIGLLVLERRLLGRYRVVRGPL